MALIDIMSNKPHKIRKNWLKVRDEKERGVNVVDKNLRISKTIDKLNYMIDDNHFVDEFLSEESKGLIQLSFDFN